MPGDPTRFTILVVEDDALIRMLGVDILEAEGFLVFEAGNADEAVTILARHAGIELLFSDVDMPGSMNGIALACLAHDRWPGIRVLLTSGQHTPPTSALPAASAFLSKPWTSDKLVSTVQEILAA